MGALWEKQLHENELLIMLALGDHADHTGGNAHPSTKLLAWKTGYSKRQVQRILRTLEENGWITAVAAAGRRKPTTYRINLADIPEKPPYVADDAGRGDILTPQNSGVTKPAVSGDSGVTFGAGRGDTAMSPEPSVEPSGTDEPSDSAGKPPKAKPWTQQACDLWMARFDGTAPGGRIGKALKPLVEKHGAETVLERFQRYLAEEDPRFATPETFATKYGAITGESNGHNGNGAGSKGRRGPPARAVAKAGSNRYDVNLELPTP